MDPGARIAVDPVRQRLLVADGGQGRLIVIDLATGGVARTIQVMPPIDAGSEGRMTYFGAPVVDLASGRVFVTGGPARDGAATGALASGRPVVGPIGLAKSTRDLTPVGVGGGSLLYVVDPDAGRVRAEVDVPGIAWTRAADPGAGTIYLSVIGGPQIEVRAVDTTTLALGPIIAVPGETTLDVDPATGAVWVAGDGVVTILR